MGDPKAEKYIALAYISINYNFVAHVCQEKCILLKRCPFLSGLYPHHVCPYTKSIDPVVLMPPAVLRQRDSSVSITKVNPTEHQVGHKCVLITTAGVCR